jgi:hypothetical protein
LSLFKDLKSEDGRRYVAGQSLSVVAVSDGKKIDRTDDDGYYSFSS